MENFFAEFEAIFWKLWNKLYEYLCEFFEADPNPDWYAPLPEDE